MEGIRGRIKAVCISEKRGIAKKPTLEAELVEGYGIVGDAHAGNWHRQVSILTAEVIDDFRAKGAEVSDGDFGENLIIEGFNVRELPAESLFFVGKEDGAVLRLTQRGKECHSHCHIYNSVGDCIMPREGVFTEVIKGGRIRVGDEVRVELPAQDRALTVAVIVLSDKGSKGEREDKSGPAACEILEENGYRIIETLLIPDEPLILKKELIRICDGREADLVITSGGTGFSMRDHTPEVTLEVADRNAPGIAEYMRMRSAEITDRAMLSRGASVIRGHSLIVNLPGNPKAVKECLSFIMNGLEHGIKILRGSVNECANDRKE
ncbi:MAG: molybdenum cofactor biosynthesis protein [Eubacterium sp.]|nr:molybdenum cofactor biosynthesis protein [Eubacterium sp.]